MQKSRSETDKDKTKAVVACFLNFGHCIRARNVTRLPRNNNNIAVVAKREFLKNFNAIAIMERQMNDILHGYTLFQVIWRYDDWSSRSVKNTVENSRK